MTTQPQHVSAGQPRSAASAARFQSYQRQIRVPIVLAAVLPLLLAPQQGHPVSVAIGVLAWLVFVVDYAIHRRLLSDYLSTWRGKFDLAVVVLTAPWFLIPGASAGGVVVLLRLARLVRLAVASRAASELFARLGRVGIVAASVMTVCAFVALLAERPTNPKFANFQDALWWAGQTVTTLGYGDIVPVTSTGRYAAVVLMITGIAVVGLMAGSLASFLGLDADEAAVDDAAAANDVRLESLVSEVRALRESIERLEANPR